MIIALFDRNSGALQYIAKNAATALDAVVEFDEVIRINPYDLPIEEIAEEYYAYKITEEALRIADSGSDPYRIPEEFWDHAQKI